MNNNITPYFAPFVNTVLILSTFVRLMFCFRIHQNSNNQNIIKIKNDYDMIKIKRLKHVIQSNKMCSDNMREKKERKESNRIVNSNNK